MFAGRGVDRHSFSKHFSLVKTTTHTFKPVHATVYDPISNLRVFKLWICLQLLKAQHMLDEYDILLHATYYALKLEN